MSEGFDALLDQAQQSYAEGQLDRSVELFTGAAETARRAGDEDGADRATCRRGFVLASIGRGAEVATELKRLFLRSRDDDNRYAAAYGLAVGYDVDGDLEQARDWAGRATEIGHGLGHAQYTSRSANLAGALALRTAHFEDAERFFVQARTASERLESQPPENLAQLVDNLGYTMLCTNRVKDGLALCEQARDQLDRLGARHLLYETLQDLCYGYVLDDRLEDAHTCGEQALELAMEYSDQLIAKNCLFLLAEIAVRRGDTFRARRFLRELATYYPEVGVSEEIIDVFLQTDLTTVVNLRG